jgi:hypothetical protein
VTKPTELPPETRELLRAVAEETNPVCLRILALRLAQLVADQHAAIDQLTAALKTANESDAESVAMLRRARDRRDVFKEALEETLMWATPFDQAVTGPYTSELLPMYTRIGTDKRAVRLNELRKLLEGEPRASQGGERRVLEFIASRLESMLRRPQAWGSLLSVEDSILQLLELRRSLLVPGVAVNDTRRLMRAYTQFIARTIEDATAEPLAIQLERLGRAAEFTTLMSKFVESETATCLAEERDDARKVRDS